MGIKEDFQKEIIKNLDLVPECVIVKPNWISERVGEFTSSRVLDWTLECFPFSEKFVVESYTSWRSAGEGVDGHDLEMAFYNRDDYRKGDVNFLSRTGNSDVLAKHNAKYINVTDEFWNDACIDSGKIARHLQEGVSIMNEELLGYVPSSLFYVPDNSLFVSLARIKFERQIPNIVASLGVKNLFGLIPHPSRKVFHGIDDCNVASNVLDVYNIYDSLFEKMLFIVEGIGGMLEDYCSDSQRVVDCGSRFYVGRNGISLDRKICEDFGVNPDNVGYLR